MLNVRMDLYGTGQATKVFNSKGDGLVGYKVIQIVRDLSTSADDAIYKEVSSQ